MTTASRRPQRSSPRVGRIGRSESLMRTTRKQSSGTTTPLVCSHCPAPPRTRSHPCSPGGSNIAISAASEKQDLARDLMRIIFSEEYQTMLAENGLGPANTTLMDAFVDLNPVVNEPAADAALGSKLTPAAPGWAAFEGANILEEFFGKIAEGGDVADLAAEYDELLNG